MVESVLERKHCSVQMKWTVKGLISAGLVALAVILPQIVHLVAGQAGGVQWLPMYLPVLLGGCLLGTRWGLCVGLASPMVSCLITSAVGNPMPVVARLPFMMLELAVFAAVSGLFTKKIAANGWMAFPAVLLAQVCGRSAFLLTVCAFQGVSPLVPATVAAQIQTGLCGVILQAVLVPFAVMGLNCLLQKDGKND